MHYFPLRNLQDVFLYLFPTLIFLIIFGLFLGYTHFHTKNSDKRLKEILYRFPGGIEDRNAPFPLAMTLTIVGTVVWAFFYILFHGLLGVKI
ncbi:MAG: hypothetical protein PVG78_00900 [Desulfobacterales bacterium]|jgi:hypothetical protein